MQNPIGMNRKKAVILRPTPENIHKAAEAVRSSDVIGMPTETVYGLAGRVDSIPALTRIFETKERPTFDPLIVHVGPTAKGIQKLSWLKLIDRFRLSSLQEQRAELLMNQFWPGPLTIVLPKHPEVPDLVTSGLPSVAIRMPKHPIAQALIETTGIPLAAPSANRFGRISPTTASAVFEELGDRIQWILEGGECEIGLESTVVDLTDFENVRILRPGGIAVREIETTLGIQVLHGGANSKAFHAPGMLPSHYAPKTPLKILPKKLGEMTFPEIEATLKGFSYTSIGILLASEDPEAQKLSKKLSCPLYFGSLSSHGDLKEMAHRLFAEMRKLDSSGADLILAEPCPYADGLGYAITDRLTRASHRS